MKRYFEPGSSDIKDFFIWLNERHAIWKRRKAGMPKPWTSDVIMQQYKFNNVYRQLDKTTVAFRERILDHQNGDHSLILFNVIWFRLFGRLEHTNLGFVHSFAEVKKYFDVLHKNARRIFVGAFMPPGSLPGFVDKYLSCMSAIHGVWECRQALVDSVERDNTLQSAWNVIRKIACIGPFYAYEMVCDLRFTPVLNHTTDKCKWANFGPGSSRGLLRLGMPFNQTSYITLLHLAKRGAFTHIKNPGHKWPFELREIEHSLCEFDKYERKRRGETKVLKRYRGL